MRSFRRNEGGAVAIVFAISLIPILGVAGAAIDYSQASAMREHLRLIADQTALHVASASDQQAQALAGARASVSGRWGSSIDGVRVEGTWLDDRHYQVRISARAVRGFLAGPAIGGEIATGVVAVARRTPPTYRTLPPRRSLLDPEAGDYNRVHMYCFDPVRGPASGRSGLVPIADNATPPTDYSNRRLPTCGPGEVASYMLRNVRGQRGNPRGWDDPNQEVYEYYADATIDPNTGRVVHTIRGFRVRQGVNRDPIDMTNHPILETILCRTEAECRPVSQGGIIPNRRTNRDPQVATGACRPGMFMYFGWEDRPPGLGWTDRDYDDIRLVVSCPEIEEVTSKEVVLVR